MTTIECKTTPDAPDYRGRLNQTKLGLSCQRWDMKSPHWHRLDDPALYGEIFISDAWNYCRNPDMGSEPWCYTTNLEVRFDYCDIPMCGKYTKL